jgi:hypothetical protein
MVVVSTRRIAIAIPHPRLNMYTVPVSSTAKEATGVLLLVQAIGPSSVTTPVAGANV